MKMTQLTKDESTFILACAKVVKDNSQFLPPPDEMPDVQEVMDSVIKKLEQGVLWVLELEPEDKARAESAMSGKGFAV